ncbi:hypothetical protein SD70_27175 [Gordoniibacillus kamchatkensis]|uniref:Uncharacterized protein n=1 Tax=Gordoniibacillus kamchatkensis TaxID=1590651 RepID=A0ABR5ABG0_9BACL|nr:hypothetical protein [Paenibacillus sp. VKM B-2647]KIL38300.1 hypothetical protein SD70_27175 [Paenibacillus sp. VKM B-2647]
MTWPKRTVPSSGSVYQERVFSGFAGLNNKYSNEEIADNESPDLLNVDFDVRGAIIKRKGFTLAKNFGTAQINSIIPFYKTDGTRVFIVAFGTSLVQYDPVAQTTTTITTTLHGNGLRFTGAIDTVHNVLYLVNGDTTDGLMSWDGTTFTKAIAGAPNGKYIEFYKNRMYICGDPANPNRLYMSDLGTPTSWPALNFTDIDDGLGGITGIKQFGDSQVIFKEMGVFILKGSDPSNYVVVTTFAGQHGAISHYSIVRIPNGLMYLSRDGIYLFDGKHFTLMSDKIQGSVYAWNQQYLGSAVAFEYDHKYMISVPEGVGQTTNNRTYVYSYLYKYWTRFDIPMQANCIFNGTTTLPTPYFSDTAGNVMQAFTGDNDNGAAINSYFLTKNYDFGTSAHYKTFKKIVFEALANPGKYNIALTFIQDFGKNSKNIQMPISYGTLTIWGQFTWGQAKWGGVGEVAQLSTIMPGQAKYIQFRIDGNGKDQPYTLLKWTVKYKVKARIV